MNQTSGINPIYDERWSSGTYLSSGVFFLNGDSLSPSQISSDSIQIYQEIKKQKKALWPRPLAGYFSIPIYIHDEFEEKTKKWVRTRQPLKWGIWQEPILYSTTENSITNRTDYGNFGRAFFPYLNERFNLGIRSLMIKLDIKEPIKQNT